MEIRPTDTSASEILDGYTVERSELAMKIQSLHIFFSLLIPDLSHEEKQLLDEALVITYAEKGLRTIIKVWKIQTSRGNTKICRFWVICMRFCSEKGSAGEWLIF